MKAMTTSPTGIEASIDEAERLADRLERGGARGGRLFARALSVLARNLRLALFSEAPASTLTRLHLKLETTMRLADASDDESPPTVRPGVRDVDPPSQRPTIPYPPYLAPDATIEVDSRPRGVLSAATSQVRRKVTAALPGSADGAAAATSSGARGGDEREVARSVVNGAAWGSPRGRRA